MKPNAAALLEVMMRLEGTDLALVQGVSPVLQIDDRWREMDIAPLNLQDIRQLADELFALAGPPEREKNSWRDFTYKNSKRFRVSACGYPNTTAVFVKRLTTS